MSLTIPMLVTYNLLSKLFGTLARYTDDWISSVVDSFSGLTNDWYFLDKGLVPVVPATSYKKSNMSNIGWIYNTSYNVLAASHSQERSVRLPFLSASLEVNDMVYSLDEFLEEFHVIHPDNGRFLTPREIVMCWQIYNRSWLDAATLHVIDREGNDHSVDAFGDGGEAWKDLLYEFDEEEDADDEASTEEEEAEEEEEEKEEEEEVEEQEELHEEKEQEQEQEQEQKAPVSDQSVPDVEPEARLVATIDLPHLGEDGFPITANA